LMMIPGILAYLFVVDEVAPPELGISAFPSLSETSIRSGYSS
jgi:hypothetical protein